MKKITLRLGNLAPIVFGLIILLSLVGCSSGGYGNTKTSSSTTGTTAPAAGNSVNISGFAFSPASITVKVGTTLTWTNNDSTAHTVTSDNGVFDSGNLATGKTYSYTFNQAGTFPYHCAIHTSMKASVIVQ